MAVLLATWSLSLNCTCPNCGEYIDLMDEPDFWDGRRIEACENGTPRSIDFEAYCVECEHEFLVDLEY